MKTKHTQGKWATNLHKSIVYREGSLIGGDYKEICSISVPSYINEEEKERVERVANITLIASAPEMLKELQIIVKHFERPELIENVYGEHDRDIIESAKKLIKQATE